MRIASLILSMLTGTAHALVAGPAQIRGKVVRFDGTAVTLLADRYLYKIPRQVIAQKNLRSGQMLEVFLSLEDARAVTIETVAEGKKSK